MKLSMLTCLAGLVWLWVMGDCVSAADRYAIPTDERIEAVRKEFLNLRRPISYEYIIDQKSRSLFANDAKTHVDLRGSTLSFTKTASKEELVYALWPYLEDEAHDAEASIILLAVLRPTLGDIRLSYRSLAEPGNWQEIGKMTVDRSKRACWALLGKSRGWYPHTVMFDEDIIRRGRTNETLRAQQIEAMRSALRDPSFAKNNPLEFDRIFYYLSILKAKEAAPEAVMYFFYNSKQKADYRSRSRNSQMVGETNIEDIAMTHYGDGVCGASRFLAQAIGESTVQLVLERLFKSTPKERAIAEGGGCAPLFVLDYFVALRYSRAQTVEAVEHYIREHPHMTREQVSAVESFLDILRTGKYQRRFHYFKGWTTEEQRNSYIDKH